MTPVLLLDTSVFSRLLRHDRETTNRIIHVLSSGADVIISPVVYYELRRGLLKVGALNELRQLDVFIAKLSWSELTRGDWEEAADLWVKVHRSGRPREDADLLIAAQANRRGAVVVTGNIRHFRDIANHVQEW